MSDTGPRRKKIKVQKGEGLWLMSFSDLSMVLIAFFILMLSYSKPDKKKVENVESAMQSKDVKDQNNLEALQAKIKEEVKKSGLEASAKVTYDVDGLSVEFKDSLLFNSGSSLSNPQFERVVGSVINVIAGVPKKYELIFEGHTDDTPIARGGAFKTNWELSAARGITLLQHFQKRGVRANKMSIAAYGDTRPKVPVRGLKGAKLRQARARNRRVVIRIE